MKIAEPIRDWFSICCVGKLPIKRLRLREYFLFPLPVLIAYVLLSLYPNFLWVLQGENTHWFKNAQSCDVPSTLKNCYLRYNINWFVLTTYALYAVLIYKNRFLLLLNDFKDKKVIDHDTYKEAKNSLVSKKRFFLFLALFEILFYISWYQPYEIPKDIAGIFIAVIILPIGAQIFSAFTAGVIFPITLSKRAIRVNVFDVDKRGGLKPISELLIVLTAIYFFGIFLTFILYPPFYATASILARQSFGLIFIMFGVFIFFVPQIYIHRSLTEEKTGLLRDIQDKISNWIREAIEIEHNNRESQDARFQDRLSSFQKIRSEIDIMGTWPFDLNILKFLFSSSIPIIFFVVNLVNSNEPLSFHGIINLLNQILKATPNK
jgi:hypothetical protein